MLFIFFRFGLRKVKVSLLLFIIEVVVIFNGVEFFIVGEVVYLNEDEIKFELCCNYEFYIKINFYLKVNF